MLNKKEHIEYWVRSGLESWEAAIVLFHGKKNVEALFFFCLAIEKLLKANWLVDNILNVVPRIHDLRAIIAQTEINLNSDQLDFLNTVDRWNLEGRYPDYKFKLSRQADAEYMVKQIVKLEEIKKCLLERL